MRLSGHNTIILFLIYTLACYFPAKADETVSTANEENPNEVLPVDSAVYLVDGSQMIIPPLFDYVTAPDDLPDLQSRTDYLMEHFWDPFDFKNNQFVDQNALNHAFDVYVHAMLFATDKKVKESVKHLIQNLNDNPGLTLQFTKAAELSFYNPKADFWADEIYMEFLQNLMDNKKIDSSKKQRYSRQLELLKRTAIGSIMPEIDLTSVDNTVAKLNKPKEYRIMEFTYPSCEDCKYSNVKLDISGTANDLIDDGKLDVAVVMMGYPVKENYFPAKWMAFSSDKAKEILDIRVVPSFYVIDKNNKILGKNLSVDDALELIESNLSR